MKRGYEETITLISKEGIEFQISVEYAKSSQTIMNFIEDNGTESPMQLNYISTEILKIIVFYLEYKFFREFCVWNEQLIILVILAANYLDVKELLGKLFIFYKNKKADFVFFKDNGFKESEKSFIHSRQAHLKDIHYETMREPPINRNDYTLLDVPKILIQTYYFEPFNFEFFNWFNNLINFRKQHVYFWHFTTNYIINQVRAKYSTLNELTDDQTFQIIEYCARNPKKKCDTEFIWFETFRNSRY